MIEKSRQSPVGAWHSAEEFLDSPKNRPNATPSYTDVTKKQINRFLSEILQCRGRDLEAFVFGFDEKADDTFWSPT
jgi:hypothetical protein